MKYLFLYFLFIFSTSIIAQEALGFNLALGDTFSVEQEANQHITQEINGVSQIIENHLIGQMFFTVIDTNTENYTLSMVFKRLKMQMSSPTLGELSNFDTNSIDTTDITIKLFKGILDIPVTLIMHKNGKIISVTGGEQLISSMFESADIQPEIIDASKAQMEKQFGSEALGNSFEQMTYFYPVKPVSIGKEWANTYTGALSAKNKWKLESVSSDAVIISGTATTTMTTMDENTMMSLNGFQKTSVIANPKNGLFKELKVTGENSGDTVFQSQNISIPTNIKSTITYKISQ